MKWFHISDHSRSELLSKIDHLTLYHEKQSEILNRKDWLISKIFMNFVNIGCFYETVCSSFKSCYCRTKDYRFMFKDLCKSTECLMFGLL